MTIHTIDAISRLYWAAIGFSSKSRPNEATRHKVVEDPTNFIIARLGRVELEESGDFIEWWDGAAIVRGNAEVRIPDQECVVEVPEQVAWYHGRIARLCARAIRERSRPRGLRGIASRVAIGLCANTSSLRQQ